MIPRLRTNSAWSVRIWACGVKPSKMATTAGWARQTSAAKMTPTVKIAKSTINSILRIPKRRKSRTTSTSAIVSRTPTTKGRPKRSLRATAVPTTPVRSVAIIAISLRSQRVRRTGLLTRLAIAWARSVRVTTPSLIDSDCMTIAIRMEQKRTIRSW